MKVKEIRELSEMELDKKLVELKQELFNLRFCLLYTSDAADD